jgi:apolipoprotein N-acyltransferase
LRTAAPAREVGSIGGRWLAAVERRPRLASLGSGALAALALPPFSFWPFLITFALLLRLLRLCARRRQAFMLGWCFGFGYFVVGLYWVAIAFFTDAERFGALAVPAVLLLCAGLALSVGLAAWLSVLRRWQSVSAHALVFALAWTAGEALRTHLFGGFPWNLIGYSWVGTPVAQSGAVIGVYGLGLASVAIAALPALLLERDAGARRWLPVAASLMVLALAWLGGAWRLAGAEAATVPQVHLRLVQGNIPQHHKWDPALRAQWFQRHLDLSLDPDRAITHVIWPESATPYSIEGERLVRQKIAEVVPDHGYVITGGERFDLESEPPRAWNSLFVLDAAGNVVASYDKRELVPFGEYLPLRGVLERIGFEKVTRGSIDFQPGTGPALLEVPGLPPFRPLICYEVIFSGEITGEGPRPDWLLNITNDAWFGDSSGPYQHLAMARMRSIEEGLPLVRAANTGISAVIDPWGRELARLPLGESGVLDVELPKPLPEPTVFGRYEHWPLVLLVLVTFGLAAASESRKSYRSARG